MIERPDPGDWLLLKVILETTSTLDQWSRKLKLLLEEYIANNIESEHSKNMGAVIKKQVAEILSLSLDEERRFEVDLIGELLDHTFRNVEHKTLIEGLRLICEKGRQGPLENAWIFASKSKLLNRIKTMILDPYDQELLQKKEAERDPFTLNETQSRPLFQAEQKILAESKRADQAELKCLSETKRADLAEQKSLAQEKEIQALKAELKKRTVNQEVTNASSTPSLTG